MHRFVGGWSLGAPMGGGGGVSSCVDGWVVSWCAGEGEPSLSGWGTECVGGRILK
jgi:hypothetical protein